jgi:hypothetical protein
MPDNVMPNDAAVSVFLSHARADGETRAAKLRERLKRQARDIDIKYDRLFLEGGRDWWKISYGCGCWNPPCILRAPRFGARWKATRILSLAWL